MIHIMAGQFGIVWQVLFISGKNPKSGFFLLGLMYTSRKCFESKKFLSKSCPELSNQVLSFSEGQFTTSLEFVCDDPFSTF